MVLHVLSDDLLERGPAHGLGPVGLHLIVRERAGEVLDDVLEPPRPARVALGRLAERRQIAVTCPVRLLVEQLVERGRRLLDGGRTLRSLLEGLHEGDVAGGGLLELLEGLGGVDVVDDRLSVGVLPTPAASAEVPADDFNQGIELRPDGLKIEPRARRGRAGELHLPDGRPGGLVENLVDVPLIRSGPALLELSDLIGPLAGHLLADVGQPGLARLGRRRRGHCRLWNRRRRGHCRLWNRLWLWCWRRLWLRNRLRFRFLLRRGWGNGFRNRLWFVNRLGPLVRRIELHPHGVRDVLPVHLGDPGGRALGSAGLESQLLAPGTGQVRIPCRFG